MSSQEASRAMLSASGLPVPFSIRDKVEADTPVCSATSRKLKPCCSRRRRTAPPSSEVLTPVFFAMPQAYHPSVLAARLCFTVATLLGAQTSCLHRVLPKRMQTRCLRSQLQKKRGGTSPASKPV